MHIGVIPRQAAAVDAVLVARILLRVRAQNVERSPADAPRLQRVVKCSVSHHDWRRHGAVDDIVHL